MNGLTFFGVTRSILAGMTHHPIRLVPWSVFQHVIPEIHKKETCPWLEFTQHSQVEPKKTQIQIHRSEKSLHSLVHLRVCELHTHHTHSRVCDLYTHRTHSTVPDKRALGSKRWNVWMAGEAHNWRPKDTKHNSLIVITLSQGVWRNGGGSERMHWFLRVNQSCFSPTNIMFQIRRHLFFFDFYWNSDDKL